MTVLPAAAAYARHFRSCNGRPCAPCDHLAARMAAEADGEADGVTYQAVAEIVWSGPSRQERSKAAAMTDYERVAGQLLAHPQQCPDLSQPCHAWLSRLVDAASLAYDNAVAASLMNRYGSPHTIPVWLLPRKEITPTASRPAHGAASGAQEGVRREG